MKFWTVRYTTPDKRRGTYLPMNEFKTAAEAMAEARADLPKGYTVTSAYESESCKRIRLRREGK